MPIPRVAYFAQKASITLYDKDWNQVGSPSEIPVNSANVEVSRPIEAVTAFGKFKSFNTAQTNVTTCKSSLKCYLGSSDIGAITAGFLDGLVTNAQVGYAKIEVAPAGFTMYGILTSMGIDIALGGFGMVDLGFAGVGNPTIASSTSATTVVYDDTKKVFPVTTLSVGGEAAGAFATSIKFSYDLPTDVLGALGENPNALQGPSMKSIIASKAPYKASVSVEGYGVDASADVLDATIQTKTFSIGDIGISLPNGKISARSFNNAAGQVSATFSYTIEDVGATITAVAVDSYTQNLTQAGLPMYGG